MTGCPKLRLCLHLNRRSVPNENSKNVRKHGSILICKLIRLRQPWQLISTQDMDMRKKCRSSIVYFLCFVFVCFYCCCFCDEKESIKVLKSRIPQDSAFASSNDGYWTSQSVPFFGSEHAEVAQFIYCLDHLICIFCYLLTLPFLLEIAQRLNAFIE